VGDPALLEETGARPTRRSRCARFGLEQGARYLNYKPALQACPAVLGCIDGVKNTDPDSRGRRRASQGTRAAGKPSGGILFGYFLLAAQEKVPRPKRAKHANKKVDAPRPKGAKHVLQKQTKPAPKGQNTEPKKARHQGRALLPRWRRTGCYLRAPGPLISRPLLM
jgi:hypothetical protein